MVAPILEYPTPPPQPRERLTLEEGSDFARIVFPILPAWIYILPASIVAATAIMSTIAPLIMAVQFWRTSHIAGRLPPAIEIALWHSILFMLLGPLVGACFEWLFVLIAWRRYRRYGRVPHILVAEKEGLTLSHLGWQGMRQKHWSANEITAIELKPLRGDLIGWRPTFVLTFLRKRGKPLNFRLSSKDSQLLAKIAGRFRALLGEYK